MKILFFLTCFFLSTFSYAAEGVFDHAPYTLCFTPGGNCTRDITAAIRSAHHSIHVQAFSFTSMPITMALVHAHQHQVEVFVILDKSQRKYASFAVKTLLLKGVHVSVDEQPAIAHNKVMVIDDETVITGSFNFTNAAQYHNAENVLIVHDTTLAQRYLHNWRQRYAVSVPLAVTDLGPTPWWKAAVEPLTVF